MRKKTIMVMIGGLTFSGCVDSYHVIHEPYTLKEQCVFEKFTEVEKSTMKESVGRKIRRNQKKCFDRHTRNLSDVEAHNEKHDQ